MRVRRSERAATLREAQRSAVMAAPTMNPRGVQYLEYLLYMPHVDTKWTVMIRSRDTTPAPVRCSLAGLAERGTARSSFSMKLQNYYEPAVHPGLFMVNRPNWRNCGGD